MSARRFASVQYSILPLLWVLLGGAATTLGPLLGTLFMYYVIDITSGYTSAYLLVVGVALILLVLFFPEGHSRHDPRPLAEVAAMTPLLDHDGPEPPFRRPARPSTASTSTLMPGEIRAIIGPNGAGKTTFVSLVCGRIAPSAGTIIFDGEDITALPPHQRVRRGIAYTFQITSVFANLTAYDNVALPVQRTLQRRARPQGALHAGVMEALARTGLAGRADVLAGHAVLRPPAPARSGDGPGAEAAPADPRRADAGPVRRRDRRASSRWCARSPRAPPCC